MPNGHPISKFQSARIGSCFLRITLDTRHVLTDGTYRTCVLIHWSPTKQHHYYHLGRNMTVTEFNHAVMATGKGKNNKNENESYSLKLKLIEEFNVIVEKISLASHESDFSLKKIVDMLTKMETSENFSSYWEQYAYAKKGTTRESYLNSLSSFQKAVKKMSSFDINISDIENWKKSMEDSGLSSTTIGIYMRACRAVVNSAIASGHMPAAAYPFGKGAGKVSIPAGKSRKKEYLPIEKMDILYGIFSSQQFPNGNKINGFAKKILGMFLIQYFGNGINMADLARLVYNDYYFNTKQKALSFTRKKVESRTDQEVIIPITSEIKTILDSIANHPTPGGLLFPWITGESDMEKYVIKRIATVNGYVRKVMAKITAELGWPEKVSSTWARHSFATNLAHQGVPQQYISEAMGHSIGSGSVTQRYIDVFPLEKQMEFNSLLLGGKKKEKTITISQKEYEELIKMKNSK